MKKRLLTSLIIAAVYIIVLVLTIYVHKIFFDIFVLLLMVVAALEVAKALGNKFSKPINLLPVITAFVGYVIFYLISTYSKSQSAGLTSYFAVLAIMCIVSLVYTMFSKRYTIHNVFTTILVMIYPISLLIYMLGLNYVASISIVNLNIAAIMLLVLVATLTDTFAYFFGSIFKGAKLCPAISPKKTISGALGGLFGGVLAGAIMLLFSVYGIFKIPALSSSVAFNAIHYLVIGLVGAAFVQLGDLIASYIKRQCEIKDFGKILPGHGGIIDRIDGMILLSVFLYIYMNILVL